MAKKYEFYHEEFGNQNPIAENDIRIVELPVKVVMKWSDKIVDDVDDDNNPISYTSGWLMHVLPNQSFVYNDEETVFFAQSKPE